MEFPLLCVMTPLGPPNITFHFYRITNGFYVIIQISDNVTWLNNSLAMARDPIEVPFWLAVPADHLATGKTNQKRQEAGNHGANQ
jgi:hypothetical protein